MKTKNRKLNKIFLNSKINKIKLIKTENQIKIKLQRKIALRIMLMKKKPMIPTRMNT